MTSMVQDVRAVEAATLLQNYKRFPVVFVRGEGTRLIDENGRRYLDLLSGIGVASLGHAHPAMTRAIAEQAATLLQTSNLYFHPLQGELATRLTSLTGLDRAFFCNSGTEAMEASLKFARRYWYTQGAPRPKFIGFEHGFHGRTMGALSVTWDEHYRTPFEPLVPGATLIPTDDPQALLAAADDTTAAIVVEPIRGEGGVRPIPRDLAAAIAEAARRTGALIIADEVQSGSWRTGPFLHAGEIGLEPDLVTLAKALGGGVPIGAVLMADRVAQAVSPGDHGTTYGGNLLSCRAALTFLDVVDSLHDQKARSSERLFVRLRALAAKYGGLISGVRGAGHIAGIEFTRDALPVANAALERGLIVNRTTGTVIRLLPPYIITEAEVDEGIDMLDEAIRAAF
jgi:acetylornithine aminotransferase/acetylornithine/N-succinyldiaminopimelate aminotransferase